MPALSLSRRKGTKNNRIPSLSLSAVAEIVPEHSVTSSAVAEIISEHSVALSAVAEIISEHSVAFSAVAENVPEDEDLHIAAAFAYFDTRNPSEFLYHIK